MHFRRWNVLPGYSDIGACACLLGAIHPDVNVPQDCSGGFEGEVVPANLMPLWLAETTMHLFDGLPAAAMYPIANVQWDSILTKYLTVVGEPARRARYKMSRDASWVTLSALERFRRKPRLRGEMAQLLFSGLLRLIEDEAALSCS